MKEFKLFADKTSTAITYYNGDHKKLASINPHNGNLKLYVNPTDIPGKTLLRIEHEADCIYSNTHQ